MDAIHPTTMESSPYLPSVPLFIKASSIFRFTIASYRIFQIYRLLHFFVLCYKEKLKNTEEPESMLEILLLSGAVSSVITIIAALIAFKFYQRTLNTSAIQQQGWEHAQETRQQQWLLEQEKHFAELEKKLSENIRQVQQEWQAWEQRDSTRVQTLEQKYSYATKRTTLEHELEHLPHLEDASLPSVENQRRRSAVSSAIPSHLEEADLTGRDLSRRFLSGANLRGAHLAQANLFMADLSDACLAEADLSGADLSGANLMGADLRGAVLVGANVLVADMNNATLFDANLVQIRNLTIEQIKTAIYDSTTQFDGNVEITLPRIPSIPKTLLAPVVLQAEETSPLDATQTPAVVAPMEREIRAYDIVRAQSLNALPVVQSSTTLKQTFPMQPFPGTLPETPLPTQDEGDISSWSLLPSEDTLRLLEGLSLPTERAEHYSSAEFATSSDTEDAHERRHVKAS